MAALALARGALTAVVGGGLKTPKGLVTGESDGPDSTPAHCGLGIMARSRKPGFHRGQGLIKFYRPRLRAGDFHLGIVCSALPFVETRRQQWHFHDIVGWPGGGSSHSWVKGDKAHRTLAEDDKTHWRAELRANVPLTRGADRVAR
ncbi:hypothetical protein BDP55DRAFT_433388 [Colletotrichum godetiae]|uniref:Uncharacterized protein n=1 Tax=Colletotrichum godetiae TaxID=1209918 RepID=A0AAJ0ARV9_9PEZI|nr:uncharacterized protein BDP55DRAFT_433388 [Colletotrichum godetiae]KAK1689238.1 hypothetical protein BDP55DRAFT_433388 [Colletotrichum godetiae]